MRKKEFNNYLGKRYYPQIKWFDNKSVFYKRWTHIFQILIIVLSSVTPVFAALEYKILTIITAAIVAVATGILKYTKFEELWRNYRVICEILKREKYNHDFNIGVYKNESNPDKLFIERVESILSKQNEEWVSLIEKKNYKKR